MFGLLACAALALLAAPAAATTCGTWTASCGSYYNGSQFAADNFVGSLQFNGLTAGNYTWLRTIFSGSCSGVPVLHIEMGGAWIDYVSKGTQAERYLYMTSSQVKVTPGSDAVVTYLNKACPCGTVWKKGQTAILNGCKTDTCDDTTWLGGTPDNKTTIQQGVVIGQPFYASFYAPVWGTSGQLLVSYLDANALIGWSNEFPFSGNNYTGTACTAGLATANICGDWQEYCSPAALGTSNYFQSVTSSFSYYGPTPQSSIVVLSDACCVHTGSYSMQETLYIDQDCTYPFLFISHSGAISYQGSWSSNPGGFAIQRFTPSVSVTPATDAATNYLTAQCPCGGSWKTGVVRYLTACAANTCNDTVILHGGNFGMSNYAGFQASASAKFQQLQFSEYVSSVANLPIVFTQADSPFVGVNSCPVSTNQFCGIFHQTCSQGADFDNYDFIDLTQFGGAENGGSGTFQRTRNLYVQGGGCTQQTASILEEGFYSLNGASNATAGASNFLLSVPRTTVTPMSADFVTYMQSVCACAGTWQINVPRLLTYCSYCDATFFTATDLGIPGFGNIIAYPELVRFSHLSFDQDVGYSTPLAINDFPLSRQTFCLSDPPSYEFVSSWEQPCRTDILSGFDVAVRWDISDDGTYTLVRLLFDLGSGCPLNGTSSSLAIQIYEEGSFKTDGHTSVVSSGENIELSFKTADVTATNVNGKNYLNYACNCGGTWSVNVTRDLLACDLTACETYAWIRHPIGPVGYGIAQRLGDELRVTSLAARAQEGWVHPFNITDFIYEKCDETTGCTIPIPNPPMPSKAASFPGGGVFLILLFVPLFLYFVIGTGYNFSKSGQATIPNETFWRGLPGLITAGFRFTFVEFFGLNSSPSSSGYSQQTNKPEGYGTLGN